jgi:hypothetical protein
MSFVIPNITFVILLAIATSYLTFLTTKGSLTNNTYSRWWNKLTKRGKLVLYVLLFMFVILVCQEYNSWASDKNKDIILEKERNSRDSLITIGIKSGVESSSDKLFKNLSMAFAKQNLKIDTLRNTVIKLKDSVSTTINNYAQEDPVLSIEIDGIYLKSKQDTKYDYGLAFKSMDAGSTNYKVLNHIFVEYKNGTYSLHNVDFLSNVKIPKNGKWTTGFQIHSLNNIKFIYVYIKGTYTTLDGIKSYPIDDIYVYEEETKETFTLTFPKKDTIITLIKSHLAKK